MFNININIVIICLLSISQIRKPHAHIQHRTHTYTAHTYTAHTHTEHSRPHRTHTSHTYTHTLILTIVGFRCWPVVEQPLIGDQWSGVTSGRVTSDQCHVTAPHHHPGGGGIPSLTVSSTSSSCSRYVIISRSWEIVQICKKDGCGSDMVVLMRSS